VTDDPARPAASTPSAETFGVVLTPLGTAFNSHAGIDYHQPSRNVLVSANSPTGQPHNFELIDGGGAHHPFSNVGGLGGALKLATARDDGQGASLGGFRTGELFTGTGAPGVVARIAPDGAAVQNPWVTLPGEAGLPGGLHVDRTGVFGGDLIVVTDAGGVWRISAAGAAALVASLSTPLAGVTTIPDDAAKHGPWAGKILAGAKEQGAVYVVDAQGGASSYPLGINPEEIELVPAHENFFGLDPADGRLWGAPADAFATMIGDVLVAQGSPGVLKRVRWSGTEFETAQLTQVTQWGQITFAPAGVAELRGVKQVYDKLAVVRHAPVLNSGRVEGALWQLSAENVTFGGMDVITSDLLVPGTPAVAVADAHPNFGGVIEGVEDSQPDGYTVSIGGNASLRHLITRTNPIELEPVAAPTAPNGTRDVSVTKEDQLVGDFSTLRNLSLSGKAGAVSVPPGTYGSFSAGGRTALVLGVENATEPAIYNLQGLTLAGGSELRLAGPVVLTVRGDVSLTGSTLGAADNPRRLLLKVAEGGVKVGGGAVLYGVVRAPRGAVEIAGRGRVRGTVMCDRLSVSGNGVLQVTESDVPPPPVNRPPAVDAGPDQTLTLPADTVSLNGTAGDDGLPQGGELSVNWSASSGPGPVSFGSPASAATTATFVAPGVYVLKLMASDGQLTRSDSVQVEVVPRNQPPAVDAGPDQTILLSDTATLSGSVSDDALPRGSTLTVSWGAVSGPGTVTFGSPDRASTTAAFSDAGTYVLLLTASDTELDGGDEVTVVVNPNSPPGRVYTLSADFDEGSYINVTHSTPDQLQIDETARTLNFIWVAVSSKGTVVKIDTETGAVLGEYFTSPNGQPRNPSRTTVDQNGNVWATNRDGNSVLRIGLVENGQCVDRNGNGVIDTSTGYGDIRPWTNAGGADTGGGVTTAQDECIINYTKVNSSGTRHVSVTKDNDVWVSGTGGQRFDLIDGKTGLVKRSEPSVGYGGYGGLIDKAGVIWSARSLLRWDTANPLTGPNGGNWKGYGHDSYGLCIDGKGNVWNTSLGGNLIYKFAPDGTHLGTFNHGAYWAQGCVVDKNDDVWVAHSLNDSSVGHLKSNGAFVGNVSVGSGPTGVAVDARGKVWATNHNSWNVSRIDPNLGPVGADGVTPVGQVDLTTRELGGYLYNYSDMTGSTLSGAPDQGTWSAVFDSEAAGAEWGRVGWTAKVCGDGLLTVSVATGEDGATFGQPIVVSNGDDPEVPAGRYARVSVKFERASSGESPVLYDLSISTAGFELETPANLAPDVDAGPDQTLEGVTKTSLHGITCDDGMPSNQRLAVTWSKVSGPGTVNFARPDSAATEVTFSVPGNYELKLTASDSAFTRGDTVVVEVLPGNEPPSVNAGPDQAVTHPAAANLNGTITDDGLPRGATLLVTWSKLSGPGTVTFAAPNAASTTARFGAPGTYVLKLTASDTESAAHDEVIVTVGGENQPPSVNAGPDRTITLPNTATLDGTATDDGWPEGGTLAASWSVVSGSGAVTFNQPNAAATVASFAEPGEYVLRLTAGDSLLSASDEVSVSVNPAIPPPVVSLHGLPDGAELTERVNVGGTVSTGSNWRLEYAPGGGSAGWTTLASGNTPVTNGLLGIFDPTLLLNGTYALRLVATDAAAQTTATSVSLVVAGQQKVGNFSLSFIDLNVPVAGLPIQLTRNYDSRDKRAGDFGVGWTLGIRNVRVEESGVLGADWEQTQGGGFLPTYCLRPTRPRFVTVTFPNDRVYKFQAVTSPQCSSLTPIQSAAVGFAPLPGTHGSLAALGDNDTLVFGDVPGPVELRGFESLELYDPSLYRLTAEDGTAFVIDQALGVRSITDPNGNTLTVDAGGVTHSSGKSIVFTRDAQGRITQVTDPAGNSMTYSYDARGDLVAFKDREGAETKFTYDGAHGLLDIFDPSGLRPIRNEYDEAGRLTSQTDASGREVVYARDLNARQEIVTDRLGRATLYEYDRRGNVLRVTRPGGAVSNYTYDGRDNLLSETDPAGNKRTYAYDTANNLIKSVDPAGKTTTFTYNGRGQVLTVADGRGVVATNTYDAKGNLTSSTDALGNVASVTYRPDGLPATEADALGGVTRFEYDPSGNLTKQTDPLGNVGSYTYDAQGNTLTQSVSRAAPSGALTLVTAFAYDKSGRPIQTTQADGASWSLSYTPIGRLAARVDQLGRRTSFEYDDLGRPVRTVFPDGAVEATTYDAEGRRLTTTDRAGRVTRFEYDHLGRLTATTQPDGATRRSAYDAIGRPVSTTDEEGHTTRYEYDLDCGEGLRCMKTIDALNHVTTSAFNVQGNRVSVTDAAGRTTRFEYDPLGRQTRVVFADSTSAGTTYDALGNVSSKTDQAGKTTRFEHDPLGRLVKVTEGGAQTTSYAYDEAGNPVSQTDALGRVTRYEYDALNRRVKRVLPLGMSETYAYDPVGNLVSRTDFGGKTTGYDYDVMNRLVRKRPDPSLRESVVSFSYTATGMRAAMEDATGATAYRYDARDRLTSKATPRGTLSYAYDRLGNVLSMRSSNADGASVSYSYDALNRLSAVTDEGPQAGTRPAAGPTAYTYDAVGNQTSSLYPNGVHTEYAFDSLHRITNVSIGRAALLAGYAYTLGPAGNRLSVTEAGGRTVSYRYDALRRLIGEEVSGVASAGAVSYSYDAVGNRLSRTSTLAPVASAAYAYDANDRLTNDTYDANGNTTASGGNTYSYDFENRLKAANNGEVTITYDGDGNRAAQTVGGVTTSYLVDDRNPTGLSQVVEELVAGRVTRVYTHGHSLISQNQLLDGAWRLSFYGYDGHGSVRLLTDREGNVTDTYDYDAFGNLLRRTGTTPNDYLYAGQRRDRALGLDYLRARYMNPDTGRFWSMDSFEGEAADPLSLHKYLYAHADPVSYVDPSGHSIGLAHLGAAVAIAFTLQSGIAFVLNPTMVTAAFLGFDILTAPLGFGKVLMKVLSRVGAETVMKLALQGVKYPTEASAIATKVWLHARGAWVFMGDRALVKLLGLLNKGTGRGSAGVVDFIAHEAGELLLVEAKATLSFGRLMKAFEAGGKFQNTLEGLAALYAKAGDIMPDVNRLVITYNELRSMGGWVIAADGRLLFEGAEQTVDVMINGILRKFPIFAEKIPM
jgi:RHS repeat-associated protein